MALTTIAIMAVSTAPACALSDCIAGVGVMGGGGGYGAGSVERGEPLTLYPVFKSPVCCTFPTGQCYASANLPWASVSGTAVAQVFSLSVRGKTGILRWWYDCLNLL